MKEIMIVKIESVSLRKKSEVEYSLTVDRDKMENLSLQDLVDIHDAIAQFVKEYENGVRK